METIGYNFHYILYDIFTLSFYGSPLWNLHSQEVERIYKSYNVAVRIAHKVDRTTRTFLIEPLSGCHHPYTLLCSRFLKFHQTNTQCDKPVIRMLAKIYERDLRSVYGNNLRKISKICDMDIENLSTQIIKNNVRYRNLPEDENWRIPILNEMLFAKKDINGIITHIMCVLFDSQLLVVLLLLLVI